MQAFMVHAAEGLQLAEPELFDVAVMVFDVVDDVGYDGAAFGGAELAQRVASKVLAPALAPAREVVWAASGVAALATTAGMQIGMFVSAVFLHGPDAGAGVESVQGRRTRVGVCSSAIRRGRDGRLRLLIDDGGSFRGAGLSVDRNRFYARLRARLRPFLEGGRQVSQQPLGVGGRTAVLTQAAGENDLGRGHERDRSPRTIHCRLSAASAHLPEMANCRSAIESLP